MTTRFPLARLLALVATAIASMLVFSAASASAGTPDPAISASFTSYSTVVGQDDSVSYLVTVTNTGNQSFSDLEADFTPDCGNQTGPDTSSDGTPDSFDPGDTWSFSCDTQLNGYEGTEYSEHVDVTASGDDEDSAMDSADATTQVDHPSFTASKAAPDVDYVKSGDPVIWTITVQNTGDATIGVFVSDGSCDVDTAFLDLDPGESHDIYCPGPAPDDGYNSAYVSAYDEATGDQLDAQQPDASVNVVHPDLKVDKSATEDSVTAGDTIHYTVKLDNDGDIPLWVEPSDMGCDNSTAPDGINLDADEETSFTCDHTTTAEDLPSYTNTACADAWIDESDSSDFTPQGDPDISQVCDDATTTVNAVDDGGGGDDDTPTLTIDKQISASGDAGTYADADDENSALVVYAPATLHYQTTVTTGDSSIPVHDVTFSDPACGDDLTRTGDTNEDDVLDPGESWVYTCTHVWSPDDGAPYENTATVYGQSDVNEQTVDVDPVSDSAWASIASLDVFKYGTSTAVKGETLYYTVGVSNNGSEPLTISATDEGCNDFETEPRNIDPDTTTYFYCSKDDYDQSQDSYSNTACATGTIEQVIIKGEEGPPPPPTTSDCDTVETALTASSLHITKTVDLTTADPYDVLHYTITVSNDGPEGFNYSGYVSDNGCTNLEQSGQTAQSNNSFSLDAGESQTYTCTHVFNPGSGETHDSNPYVNEACADAYVGQSDRERVHTDEKSPDVEVCDSASTALAQHTVSGVVFEDMNADGQHQDGEPGLPGFVIYGDLNNNGKRDEGEPQTTSGSDGAWSLPVDLGTTVIREESADPFTCSYPAVCAYTVNLPHNSPPAPPSRAKASAHKAADPTGKDFGDWRPATISGTVVDDANGNGARDSGEGGLAGVTVYADLNGNGQPDTGEPAVTSAADGSYAIGALKPGSYTVRQVTPSGRNCTAPSGDCSHSATLLSNGSATGRDFLDAPPPQQVVLPSRVTPGSARLAGRTGCVRASSFLARVRGKSIASLRFTIDGKVVKSVKFAKGASSYRYRVAVSKLRFGHHRLVVKASFTKASGTKSKTLRLSFQRCGTQLVAPQFTG